MRRFAFVMLVVVFLSSAVLAQKFGVEAGYSYVRLNLGGTPPPLDAQGYHVEPFWMLSKHIGLMGDMSVTYGNINAPALLPLTRVHHLFYGGGPAYVQHIGNRAMVNVHLLAGGAHVDISHSFYKQTGMAFAGGGALDIKVRDHIYVRAGQVDYIYSRLDMRSITAGFIPTTSQRYVRAGAGLVLVF